MGFFMHPRDALLFLRSARTDAAIARLTPGLGRNAALEAVYAADADPWQSASPRFLYQRRKYQRLAALLPEGRRFDHALDLGCGLGLFAAELAGRAARVTGVDVAPSAVARARLAYPALDFACHDITALPAAYDGGFDLVTIADVLYYLAEPDDAAFAAMGQRMVRLLRPGGLCLIADHYFFALDPDSRRSRRIHTAFATTPGLTRQGSHRAAFWIASVFSRT